jgi:hypothetical protein
MNKRCWFDNLPKQLRILVFLMMLVSCFFIGTRYSKAQTTTTVTVNGNTTTTVTTTTTPITSTTVPNVPNYGDQTINSTNSVNTTTTIAELNKNSGNLLTGNFCTGGWTGTQITNSPSGQTSDLGCNYLTGKGQSTYVENSFILTDKGISKIEQNLGFTQSASAYTHHFWNWETNVNMSHSVINNDTGGTITQNRVISGNRSINNGNPGIKSLDNISVGANSASGYTSKIRFDLWTPQYIGTWVGVDISQPKLSITYTGYTETTTTAITNTSIVISCESLGTCYTPPIIEVPKFTSPLLSSGSTSPIINEEQINPTPITTFTTSTAPAPAELSTSITGTFSPLSSMAPKESSVKTQEMAMATPMTFNEGPKTSSSNDSPKTEASTSTATTNEGPKTSTMTKDEGPKTSTTSKESNATTTSTTQETSSSSKTTDSKSESKSEEKSNTKTESSSNENKKTEGSTTQTANEKTVSTKENTTDTKGSSIDVKVKTAVEKVERELKNIGDKTKAIQEIKLDGIKAGAPNLAAYENRAFYEPKYYNGVPNPDFYLQADIAQKPVYANVTLSAYTNNDPIGKQQAAMQQIQDEMNDIIIQLEELKRK